MTRMMPPRARTMILWFEAQPEFCTDKTDAEIAVTLHREDPSQGWVHMGAILGNVALVRGVRRWVDHQVEGEFAGYQFNTRRTGRGRTWVHLRTREARLLSAHRGTEAQVASAEQMERRVAEERARVSLKFNAEAEEWFQLGDFQRSMVCRDSANEYEQFGYLKPATRAALQRLGLAS